MAKNESLNKKSSLDDVYNAAEAMPYYNYADALKYGKSHNAFNKFSSKLFGDYIERMKASKKTINVFDIGCSYGNSAMSIIDNLNWDEVGAFWRDPSITLRNKASFNVTAWDTSPQALEYGVRRGYFDDTKAMSVNAPYDDALKEKIKNCDILCVYMVFCYYEGDSFQRLIDLFLSNRDKEKYIIYNFTPAFQSMSIIKHTPDKYLKTHPKCAIDLALSMHRNFTEQEKKNFDSDCFGNESCNFIFGVKCLPLPRYQAKL
eukprot:202199_1